LQGKHLFGGKWTRIHMFFFQSNMKIIIIPNSYNIYSITDGFLEIAKDVLEEHRSVMDKAFLLKNIY
jgi:hypothetical protein